TAGASASPPPPGPGELPRFACPPRGEGGSLSLSFSLGLETSSARCLRPTLIGSALRVSPTLAERAVDPHMCVGPCLTTIIVRHCVDDVRSHMYSRPDRGHHLRASRSRPSL